MGRCPDCGEWNSLVEETVGNAAASPHYRPLRPAEPCQPVSMKSVEFGQAKRLKCGLAEFDRVLGGGIVTGSLILIGGDPGIGKSTLMLQVLSLIASEESKALYVSGEESLEQIKLRSNRIETEGQGLWVVSETNLASIAAMADNVSPKVMVVDSVQTLFAPELTSAPGSVSQVREATMHLVKMTKKKTIGCTPSAPNATADAA